MVDIYRNRAGSDAQVVLYLKQDTATTVTQSGAKQTRISATAYEKVKVKSFVSSETQNMIGDRKIFDGRTSTHMFGKYDISGTIEIDDDIDFWRALARGCEIYYKDTSGQYHYISFVVGDANIDGTATSLTLQNGDVLTRYNIVPAASTGGAWDPNTLNAGKIYLPEGPPAFYMKALLHPNTADETTEYFTEVLFHDFKASASSSLRTYTIEWIARRVEIDNLVKA